MSIDGVDTNTLDGEKKGKDEDQQQQWHHMVSVTDLGDLKRRIKITYDVEGVKMALDKATSMVGKRVQVKGFRRGKAPLQMVRSFCKQEIDVAASSMLSQEGYLHACFEHKIQALTEPDVKDAEFKKDGTFSCSIEVEIRPQIELTGYIGLQLSEPEFNAEETKDRLMDELRGRFASMKEQEELRIGSTAIIDYVTKVMGEVVAEQKGMPLSIEEGQPKPFGENLCGMKQGETRVVESIVLPEDFKDHGGEEGEVSVTVQSIFEHIPATDEQLVQQTGLESLEAVMRQVSEQVELLRKQHIRASLEEQVVDTLLSIHEFEVPKKWIETESEYLAGQLGYKGDNEEFVSRIKDVAERNVRRSFILDAVHDAEPSLRVTKEEFDALIAREAKRLGQSAVRLRKQLKAQGRINEIVSSVRNRKIMDFLLSNADISKAFDVGYEDIDTMRCIQKTAEEKESW